MSHTSHPRLYPLAFGGRLWRPWTSVARPSPPKTDRARPAAPGAVFPGPSVLLCPGPSVSWTTREEKEPGWSAFGRDHRLGIRDKR